MSEAIPAVKTQSAPVETVTAPVKETSKPVTKKKAAAKKATKKKVVKKQPKPKAKKKSKAKKTKKNGGKPSRQIKKGKLLNMHARILDVLDKAGDSLRVDEVAAKGGLTGGITAQYIGQLDPKARKRFEDTYLHYPTLLTLGYAKHVPGKPKKLKDGSFSENPGPAEFVITAAGRKAIRSAEGVELLKELGKKDRENGRKPTKVVKKTKAA